MFIIQCMSTMNSYATVKRELKVDISKLSLANQENGVRDDERGVSPVTL